MQAFYKFVTHDWYFAWPMFAMSLVAITLVVWRSLLNLQARTNLNSFLPEFQEKLGSEGVDGALRFCRSSTGMIPRRLYVAGLETHKQGLSAMRRSMANVVELEVLPELNFLLPTILAIAKIATMVGLLGTTIGMINAFAALGTSGAVDATKLAVGISEALVNTAGGLAVAIVGIVAYNVFTTKVDNFSYMIDEASFEAVQFLSTRVGD
jgi:biopolymer transport protein ExbB